MQKSIFKRISRDARKNWLIYVMAIPMIAYYWVFHYQVMYGTIIAFKNYKPMLGILGSPWVGFKYFNSFFSSINFSRILRNTLQISIKSLIVGFPAPIIFALLMNELRSNRLKKSVQTITYLPYFISNMVMCGMILDFCASKGFITVILRSLGMKISASLLLEPSAFQPIYVISDLWKNIGWNSIIYVSALAGVDQTLYEAATIDGAGRWKQTLHVTIPGIIPTIIVMLILRVGQIMSVGYEKIILLYNPNVYETADVISSFVYRKGLLEFNYSYGAAVGLFNSVINFALLFFTNWLSKRISNNEQSLF